MTQTKIKGWCARHKDKGFLLHSFKAESEGPRAKIFAFLRLWDSIYPEQTWTREASILTLQGMGWEVRPCTVTIQATDMSVNELRELHGITSEDRKGSREEVEMLSGKRIKGEE